MHALQNGGAAIRANVSELREAELAGPVGTAHSRSKVLTD
jgi:hypothetical protein